jgi:outer membrane immunogenic protein
MIKRQLMATVSCLALTGAASAADLRAPVPVKAQPAVVVTQIWAGPYIGINGGAVWHRLQTDSDGTLFNGFFDSSKVTATGATFGGQIGYNWQSQNFVYGLEADLNWVGGSGTESRVPFFGTVTYSTKLTWLGTARARAGLAFGRTLVYGTGGLAVGGVKNNWTFVGCGTCLVEDRGTRTGWTAGGGIEHFISNPHVTVKVEALYVDLGRSTQTRSDGDYTSRFKNSAVVGRLGLNLKW